MRERGRKCKVSCECARARVCVCVPMRVRVSKSEQVGANLFKNVLVHPLASTLEPKTMSLTKCL